MAEGKQQFDDYIAQEVQRCKGLYFPVKTGLLRRLTTRKADCRELHPNPEDEFCSPKVGPNYRIISNYQQQYLNEIKMAQPYYPFDPIVVERTHPDGYMIINGHHRWAAALRIGQSEIPIRIVNLMHEEDVRRILENSTHTKRVSLDLDEVIFRTEDRGPLEKPLPAPWSRLYRERIRLGVPALFHFLSKNGYDIWLYSAQYYSADYIQSYFERYHVKITGVMTATGKRTNAAGKDGKTLENLIVNKYRFTVHIDDDLALQTFRGTTDFREFSREGEAGEWSQRIMDVSAEIEKTDEKAAET